MTPESPRYGELRPPEGDSGLSAPEHMHEVHIAQEKSSQRAGMWLSVFLLATLWVAGLIPLVAWLTKLALR